MSTSPAFYLGVTQQFTRCSTANDFQVLVCHQSVEYESAPSLLLSFSWLDRKPAVSRGALPTNKTGGRNLGKGGQSKFLPSLIPLAAHRGAICVRLFRALCKAVFPARERGALHGRWNVSMRLPSEIRYQRPMLYPVANIPQELHL